MMTLIIFDGLYVKLACLQTKNSLQNSSKQGVLLNEILLLSLNYFVLGVKILDSVAKTIFL